MIYVNARAFIERQTTDGVELLLQIRDRPGEPRRLEAPGGQINPFEPILDALAREVSEETGLRLVGVLDTTNQLVYRGADADVECLTPFCVYQTRRGPVDSLGFYFRCAVTGALANRGDGAIDHRWFPITEIERLHRDQPTVFDWLTQGAMAYYLAWRRGAVIADGAAGSVGDDEGG